MKYGSQVVSSYEMKSFVGTEKTSAGSQWQHVKTRLVLLTIYFLQSKLLGLSDKAENHEPGN